jgi:hypothetical protein
VAHKVYLKPVIDKLGVKPGAKVAVLGIHDAAFLRQLKERTGDVSTRLRKDLDLIFFAADSVAELARLASLKIALKPDGAIWVVSLKGKAARIKDVDVIAAAQAAGLVDNKVVGFSDTHTSLRLVIPVDKRTY